MKIFCLGLHKTGTLSLAHALQEFGYRVRHGYKKQSDLIEKALHERHTPLHYIDKKHGSYDAYLDLYAVRWFYPQLDRTYPNSKFILTTRKNEDWLGSVHRQMAKRPESPFFHYWYYQTDEQRVLDKMSSEYGIREYFEDREDDFLEMNIIDNSSVKNWGQLCKFLDQDIPNKEFPHQNKSEI